MSFYDVKVLDARHRVDGSRKRCQRGGRGRGREGPWGPIEVDYRRFLLELGWGGAGHLELFGLGNDVPRHLDCIERTLSERTEMHPRIPHDLLPIMNNGGGDHYCLAAPRRPARRSSEGGMKKTESQTPTEEADDFEPGLAPR